MKSPKYSKKSKSKTYKLRMYKKGSKKRSRIKKRSRSKMYKSSKKRSRVKSKMYKSSKKRRSKKRSKSKVRIPIKQKGLLFGYHVDMTAKSRRSLLKKLLSKRKATYSQIIKRLNVLTIYNKNRHPDISEKIKRDIDFVHRHFQKYSLVYKNKSKRKSTPKRKSKYKW